MHPRELISAHLDGELDPVAEARVAAHLESCPACAAELEDVAAARQSIRSLPEPPGAAGALAGARRGSRGVRRWAVAVTAAAATAALAGAVALGPGVADAPFDLDALVEQHTARVVLDPGISTLRGPMGGP
jgi:anti-sigma factor RsiW